VLHRRLQRLIDPNQRQIVRLELELTDLGAVGGPCLEIDKTLQSVQSDAYLSLKFWSRNESSRGAEEARQDPDHCCVAEEHTGFAPS